MRSRAHICGRKQRITSINLTWFSSSVIPTFGLGRLRCLKWTWLHCIIPNLIFLHLSQVLTLTRMCLKVKKYLYASSWAMQALVFLCASNIDGVTTPLALVSYFNFVHSFTNHLEHKHYKWQWRWWETKRHPRSKSGETCKYTGKINIIWIAVCLFRILRASNHRTSSWTIQLVISMGSTTRQASGFRKETADFIADVPLKSFNPSVGTLWR